MSKENLEEYQTCKHYLRVDDIKDFSEEAQKALKLKNNSVYTNFLDFASSDEKLENYLKAVEKQKKLSDAKRNKLKKLFLEYQNAISNNQKIVDVIEHLSKCLKKHNRNFKNKDNYQAISFEIMLPLNFMDKTDIQKNTIIKELIKAISPSTDNSDKLPYLAVVFQKGKQSNSYYVKIIIVPRSYWPQSKEKIVKIATKDVYRNAKGVFCSSDAPDAILVAKKGTAFKKNVNVSVCKHEYYRVGGPIYWEIRIQRTNTWKVNTFLVLKKHFDKINKKLLNKLQFLQKRNGKYVIIKDDDQKKKECQYKYRRYMLINDWISVINILHTFSVLKIDADTAKKMKRSMKFTKKRIDLFEADIRTNICDLIKQHQHEVNQLPKVAKSILTGMVKC